MHLTSSEIATATGGRWVNLQSGIVIEVISTDTRTLIPGALFVALKGESFDAHDHLAEAIDSGASGLVIRSDYDASMLPASIPILQVSDTLIALGDLAIAWRKRCPAKRAAIVGSSGKTTTKEMIAAIMRTVGPTLATSGNLNNLIGLPTTLFSLEPMHEYAILEMGMNTPGELARLTEIAEPDLLILTNVGTAHIGQFGSQDALNEAKAEAVRHLRPETPILYNLSCPNCRQIIAQYGAGHPLHTFSAVRPAEMWARRIEPEKQGGYQIEIDLNGEIVSVELPVFGRYNAHNAVAAAAAAHVLGASDQAISQALKDLRPMPLRSEIRQIAGVTLIVDCYNANPESMKAALESLAEVSANEKTNVFAVLGDMLELGGESVEYHRALGRQVNGLHPMGVFYYGKATPAAMMEWQGAPGGARHFETHEELASQLSLLVQPGDMVFIKGSRGNKLEKVAEALESALKSRVISLYRKSES